MKLELSKSNKYAIVGFENCGTTSLLNYMQNEGYVVLHAVKSIIYGPDMLNNLKRRGYKLIILTREKPKKVNYIHDDGFNHHFEFKKYLKGINQIDVFLKLEELKKLDGFPWLNKHEM